MSIQFIDKHTARLFVSVGSGANRKQHTKTIKYNGKKDAERQYKEFETYVKGGVESSITVEELLDWYIEMYRIQGGRTTTIEQAYKPSKKSLIFVFKGIKAKELTSYHIEQYILAESKICSNKTIRNNVSLLSAAYNKAVRSGMLKDNPCKAVELPKVKKPEIEYLNEDEYKEFTSAMMDIQDLDFKVSLELALFCGLRCSEIMGIREADISLPFKVVSVRQGRHRSSVDDPKSVRSVRNIALPDFMCDDIRMLIAEHSVHDYLILNGFDEPISHNFLQKHLKKFKEQFDFDVTMHGLRHTHASLLINSNKLGVAEVSYQMGHAQTSTTLNIYTHLYQNTASASRTIANMFDEEMLQNSNTLESKKPSSR